VGEWAEWKESHTESSDLKDRDGNCESHDGVCVLQLDFGDSSSRGGCRGEAEGELVLDLARRKGSEMLDSSVFSVSAVALSWVSDGVGGLASFLERSLESSLVGGADLLLDLDSKDGRGGNLSISARNSEAEGMSLKFIFMKPSEEESISRSGDGDRDRGVDRSEGERWMMEMGSGVIVDGAGGFE